MTRPSLAQAPARCAKMAAVGARLRRIFPFHTPEARRLAILFGIVYFAQGTWYLPDQPITIALKERGLNAGQVATFFFIARFTWNVKPLYGLTSDFVPLFGRRRQSWFWLTSALAVAAGLALVLLGGGYGYTSMLVMFTLMGLGLGFTDVLTDALMVESGKPLGLTGAFQSVQWAAISAALVFSSEAGGHLAESRNLRATFAAATLFPLVSLAMSIFFVREPVATGTEREAARQTWLAVREALRNRTVWVVAGFVFFWSFSPNAGTAMIFYQTNTLHFDQVFIGRLLAVASAAGVAGALVYGPVSRRIPLRRLINLSIGIATVSTLFYLGYRDAVSAVVIDTIAGAAAIFTQIAFLDLAAKTCPRRVEATFFALLMSVYNIGLGFSQWTGGYLYEWVGFHPLILISAAMTAIAWVLVPLVDIDGVEAAARAAAAGTEPGAA